MSQCFISKLDLDLGNNGLQPIVGKWSVAQIICSSSNNLQFSTQMCGGLEKEK